MSCTLIKDELQKEFIDKGAIGVSGKITNKPLFTQLNQAYSKHIQESFNLEELDLVYNVVDNKATSNDEFLAKIDRLNEPSIAHEERFQDEMLGESPEDILKTIGSRKIEKAHSDFFSKLAGFDRSSVSQKRYLDFLDNPVSESMSTTEAKIERMKEVFNAEVVIDTDLDASGALLSANHPLSIKSGKPVIVINPNLLFADTVFHEFGHLYIELLGGLQDAQVASAVKQLEKSELWNRVAEAYPELSGDNLAKEVLATALGVKGNDIYTNVVEESIWQQIKKALLTALNNILGTTYGYNAIEEIAGQMLTGKLRVDSSTAKFNALIDQYSKFKVEGVVTQDKVNDIFERLTKKYSLDAATHVYEDTDTNEKFNNSVTSIAKQLTVGNNSYNTKGDYYTDLSVAYKLTKNNYTILLNESKLPWSLDKAIEQFFNGELGSDLPYSNNLDDKYWYSFYKELQNDALLDQDDLDSILIANFDAINERAEQIEKDKNIPMVMGNIVHEALENYVKKKIPLPTNIKDTKDAKLMSEIKAIVDAGEANGSKFYTEQILFSESAQKPGTADLIEITKDGKFRIYDFKTTKSFTNKWGQTKSDHYMYIEPGYMNQLIIYATILEEYGLKAADNHLNIISIEVDGSEFDSDNTEESIIKVTDVINRNITPNHKSFATSYRDSKRRIISLFKNPNKLKKFNITTKEEKIDSLVLKIQRGITDYKALTNERTGKYIASSLKDNNRAIYKMETDIEDLIGKNNGKIIYQYINNMHDALYNVYNESMANGQNLTSNYLANVDYLLQAADFITDTKRFIASAEESYIIENTDKKELLQLLTETEDQVAKVKDMHLHKTRELAIDTLAQNSNFMEGLFAEQFEVEAREKGKKTKEEISEYVYKQLSDSENRDLIEQKEYEYWKGLLENGYTDIRYFEYLLADPGMNKSQFVQVVKNILDKVDFDVRHDLDKSIPEIVNWHQKLSFDKKGDPKKVWGEFLEVADYTDEDGKPVKFTHASVIPESTSDYRELFLEYQYLVDDINRKIEAAFKKDDTVRLEKLKERRKELTIVRNEKLKTADKKTRAHPKYDALSKDKKEALQFIHKKLEEADARLYTAPRKRLVFETRDGSKIYNLPKMRKTNVEAAYDAGGIMNTFTSSLKDFVRPPADEDELNSSQEQNKEYEDYKTKATDILGNPSYDVPVFFRNQLEDPTLQSFDIPTLLAMNEETTIAYEQHKLIEADLHMIVTSLKNSKSLKTDALVSNNVVDKLNNKLPKELRSEDNLTLKAVQASIDNRFYKRSYQGSYSKLHYRSIKAAEALGKGTSMLLLAGNFRSATMTGIQGTIYRFIEGVAGEHFSLADAAKGSQKAYADLHEIIKDTQSQFPQSKTNLLIRKFGLEQQYKALTNKFIQDNFVTKNLDEGAMFAITSIAESMVTANLMYTLLSNIKVQNEKGDYINKEGKVVSKKEAMSLDEAYDVKEGVLSLNEHVVFTERNLNNKFRDSSFDLIGEKTIAATEISRYMRSIYADLYGQYNQDMKSVAEMHVVGKLAFSMRKWIPRGYHRRWRGISSSLGYSFEQLRDEENAYKRFYSQDQKKFQEGYYTTGVRFASTMLKEMKDKQISFIAAAKKVNSTLTTHEHANLKRLASEFVVIGVSFFTAVILRGMAKAMGDDDDRSQDKLYYLLYVLERIKIESATFINPFELIENLKNPAAAVNTITRLYNLFAQVIGFGFDDNGELDFAIDDVYSRGLRKDQYKITKHLQQLIPWYKNVAHAKGIFEYDSNETIKDSYEFMIR